MSENESTAKFPQPFTADIEKELIAFAEELGGRTMWPAPVVEVETIKGVLTEVGGNWRACRHKLRTCTPAELGKPDTMVTHAGWLAQMRAAMMGDGA